MKLTSRLILDRLEDRTLPSAPGDIEWLRQFGTFSDITALGRAVAADSDVYVGGRVGGMLPGQTSAGDFDAFVRKLDAAGNELWSRQFGTTGADSVEAVAIDGSGVIVAGFTRLALPGQSGLGSTDAFLRRYDTNGNELWTRQFGTAAVDAATGLTVDASGIYVSGYTEGVFGQSTTGVPNAFVCKYDASGAEVWTRQFSTTAPLFGQPIEDRGARVSVSASGVYVAWSTVVQQVSATTFLRRYDTDGNTVWTRQFASEGGLVGVVAQLQGAYLAGGTGTQTLPGQTSFGGGDAFVRRYDDLGNEVWTRQFGSTASDSAVSIALDAGGITVGGYTGAALPGQTSAGGQDAFVRRFNHDGIEIWTRQFGSVGSDLGASVAANGSAVYTVGTASGILGGTSQTSPGVFARKYDTAGTEAWTRQFLGLVPLTDIARAVDADGNVYVAGEVGGVLPGQSSAGGQDAFVRKYDAAGNELWTRQFGTGFPDQITGIVAGASGLFVAGWNFGALPGQTSAGGRDAFVRGYDPAGNELWTRQFGTAGNDQATGLTADASGLRVVGFTDGVFTGQGSAGGQDAFVRAFDMAGTVLWTRQFGTPGTDQATGIAADASANYLSGFTTGAIPGQASAGNLDAFVRAYDSAGNVLWTRQFGTGAVDSATGIAADASGVYVSGSTGATLAGQISNGGQDAFARKYDAAGNVVWTRQFGTPAADSAAGLAVGDSGVYIAGATSGVLPGQTGAGGQDAFVRKYDLDGGEAWSRQFGTAAADSALGAAVSTAGLFVAGTTAGSFPGQASVGLEDIFVAKVVDAFSNTPPSNLLLNLSAAIDENSTVMLSGSFADPDTGDAHTVVIDWGPGEGTTTLNLPAGVATFNSDHPYVDDGPAGTPSDVYPISVTVSDASASTSTTASLTVNNVAPTAGISGPPSGSIGESLVFTLTANDSSPADQAAGFTFRIDWDDDGVVDESVTGLSGITIAHTFTTAGTYHPSVTAEDDDTGVSQPASANVNVLGLSSIQGLVYVDSNNDGQVDFGEAAIAGVTIALSGFDDFGQAVNRSAQTDANGIYLFVNLRPSNAAGYSIAESQPGGYADGLDTRGTVNGVPTGSLSSNDVFSGIVFSQGGSLAENYNFGERPVTTGGVSPGQTATIGFWQNRNGQNLIKALNGGPTATQLGHWLAATFPNMYAALDGLNNSEVAAHYKTLFARTSHSSPSGPPKVDAQVMATAFAVYVTNQTLAGTTAAAYGFQVDATGVGSQTFNVGTNGAAFGVANNSIVSVMDLLLAVNARSRNGLLYDLNDDGQISGAEANSRTMANDVFSGINEAGDI